MKKLKSLLLTAAVLALTQAAPGIRGQSPQLPPSSAKSSPSSDTGVSSKQSALGSRPSEPPAVAGGLTRRPLNGKQQDSGKAIVPNTKLQPPATAGGSDLIAACNAAVDDLKASRLLIEALENENRAVKVRLETERQTVTILSELNDTRKSEAAAMRLVIETKNETIAAKDAVIASQDKLAEALKKKKASPWRRVGDILIGAAAAMVLR